MSSLTLERLLFDPSDATSGPVVGSYLLGTGGEVLGSTSGALNVNVENASIAITATDFDIRDLAYASDSVTAHQGGVWSSKITDGTDELAINADGSINASVSLVKTKIWDDTDYLAINADGSINSVVSATDLDIRDLAYATDSVTAHQGGTWSVTTDVTPNIVPLSSAVSVTDAQVALPTSPLSGRKRIMIQNVGADPIYIGKTGVLTTTGIKVEKGATLSLEAGPSAVYYGIAATGKTVAVRLLES